MQDLICKLAVAIPLDEIYEPPIDGSEPPHIWLIIGAVVIAAAVTVLAVVISRAKKKKHAEEDNKPNGAQ